MPLSNADTSWRNFKWLFGAVLLLVVMVGYNGCNTKTEFERRDRDQHLGLLAGCERTNARTKKGNRNLVAAIIKGEQQEWQAEDGEKVTGRLKDPTHLSYAERLALIRTAPEIELVELNDCARAYPDSGPPLPDATRPDTEAQEMLRKYRKEQADARKRVEDALHSTE